MAKKKKQKGSITKYIDKHGRQNRTYEIKRDEKGHFDKFNQVAGAIHAPKAKKLTARQKKNFKIVARAHQIIWQGVNEELRTLNEYHLIGEARAKLYLFLDSNGYTINDAGRLVKKAM